MAEPIGLVFGVASLVLQLAKCKNSSKDFHHLDQDLRSFHQTLLSTEQYLPRLPHIQHACEELVVDIAKVLSRYASRHRLRRVKVTFEAIQPLRARLSNQISMLLMNVIMLKDCDANRDERSAACPTELLHSPNVSVDSVDQYSKERSQDAAPNLAFDLNMSIVLKESQSSIPRLDLIPSPPPSLTSTESLVSNRIKRDRYSIQSSVSSSSCSTAPTELSSHLGRFESCRGRSAAKPATVQEDDLPTLSHLWPNGTEKALNEALVNISRTEEEVPFHAEQVKILLRQGASLEYKDPECARTPLIWAIVSGRIDLVELFLEEHAVFDTCDGEWARTPAIWAIVEDKLAILDLLIKVGADLTAADGKIGRTPLLWAASMGNYRAAESLIGAKAGLINVTDQEEMTPLALAYYERHLKTARLLVESGDNARFKFASGSSLLAWAILAKHEDFARLLLKHGADANSTNMDGVPALILAIQQNLADNAELLVMEGADVQCTDMDTVPALTVAVKEQRLDIAKMLLKNKARLEAVDCDGNTALWWAVWRNNEKLVELLVKSGANPAAIDGEGITVRDWAARIGSTTIVGLLSARGLG
ncbi:ankyrin repeat-containing domain protein [Pyrenochaeta sp. MPI-SDFR-AT-0127]|nr:ankyrin repeat-containing domain protein [Pyrenochaeta sp. MPI-SDFR-AT-0127]